MLRDATLQFCDLFGRKFKLRLALILFQTFPERQGKISPLICRKL